MRVFKITKGGETENPDERIVVLTRIIDSALLKKAINICAENDFSVHDTLKYIEEQFNCIDFVVDANLETFYC